MKSALTTGVWRATGLSVVLLSLLPIGRLVNAVDQGPVWALHVGVWAIGGLVVVIVAVAVAEAQRAMDLWPNQPGIARLLVDAYAARGDLDSAAAVAESALRAAPQSRAVAQLHLDVLRRWSAPPWRLAIAEIRLDWLSLKLARASRGLDSLPTILLAGADDPAFCLELETLWPGVEALRPAVGNRLALTFGAGDESCDLPRVPG